MSTDKNLGKEFVLNRQIGLDKFDADKRFNTEKGKGYAIAVLDTGIDLDNPAFGEDKDKNGIADKIKYQYDFANKDGDASDNFSGHGTSVSSIASSKVSSSIADDADLIALKVFTNTGIGSFQYIEKALQWVVTNAKAYNIKAVNMSLGDMQNHTDDRSRYFLGDQLEALNKLGVTVIATSGNRYGQFQRPGSAYPGSDRHVLGVGAVMSQERDFVFGSGATIKAKIDDLAPFSQRRNDILFAPGAPVKAAKMGGDFTRDFYGTSAAAPIIASAVVVAQDLANKYLKRDLTTTEVRKLLFETGDKVIDRHDTQDNVANTGETYSRVNVYKLAERIYSMAGGDPGTPTNDIKLSVTPLGVTEQHGIQPVFSLNLDSATSSNLEVTYKLNYSDNIALGQDVWNRQNDAIKTLVIPKGKTSALISEGFSQDSLYEKNQDIKIDILNVEGGKVELTNYSAIANIRDDDLIQPIKAFKAWGNETQSAVVKVGVLLPNAGEAITLKLSTQDGSATGDSDFKNIASETVFQRGANRWQLFEIPLYQNTHAESRESFKYTVSAIGNQTGTNYGTSSADVVLAAHGAIVPNIELDSVVTV